MKKEIREMIEELCVCDYFTLDEKIKFKNLSKTIDKIVNSMIYL